MNTPHWTWKPVRIGGRWFVSSHGGRVEVCTVAAVMDYDQLMEARKRNNQALGEQRTAKHFITVEDVQERQYKAIQKARWCLAQGWTAKAREALEGI